MAIETIDTPTGQTKVVNYYRNDAVFYTNTTPTLNSTLYVDASLQTLTPTPSSLTNVKIFVYPQPQASRGRMSKECQSQAAP